MTIVFIAFVVVFFLLARRIFGGARRARYLPRGGERL